MAISVTKPDYFETGFVHDRRQEIIMDESADVSSLPEDAVPGSFAYTADMSKIYQKSPSGAWVEIGG